MIGEISVGGVFIPVVAVSALVALGLSILITALMGWTGLRRWVWHPALFDLGVFVLLWAAVSAAWARISHLGVI